MTINESINKVQDVCMSYALDLVKESKEVKDEATERAKRKLREFVLNSIDDGK